VLWRQRAVSAVELDQVTPYDDLCERYSPRISQHLTMRRALAHAPASFARPALAAFGCTVAVSALHRALPMMAPMDGAVVAPRVTLAACFSGSAPAAATAASAKVAAPAPAAAAKPTEPPLKATEAWTARLGAQRVVGYYPCGEHAAVVLDSYMFAWLVMDRHGSSANALGEQFLRNVSAALDKVDQLMTEKKDRR